MILTGENRCSKRKTCPSATLITAVLNFTSGIPCTKFLTKLNMISRWMITWNSYTVMRYQNKEQVMECEYYETITILSNNSTLPASKVQRVSSCCILVQWWIIKCDISRVMKTLYWHLSLWTCPNYARIAYLVWQLAMVWTVQGSKPDGREIFQTHPGWPQGPPSLL
jgi:hypothetical protein